jgi:hypothetical protein
MFDTAVVDKAFECTRISDFVPKCLWFIQFEGRNGPISFVNVTRDELNRACSLGSDGLHKKKKMYTEIHEAMPFLWSIKSVHGGRKTKTLSVTKEAKSVKVTPLRS